MSPEERQKILVEFHEELSIQAPLSDEALQTIVAEQGNKTWAELEQEIQTAIIQHLFGESKVQTTPTVN